MSNLKDGDLVFFKDYFCRIVKTVYYRDAYQNPNPKYDKLVLKREYRSDGTLIKKSKWEGYTYRSWISSPDEQFQNIIDRNQQLMNVFNNLTWNKTIFKCSQTDPTKL